MGGDPVFDLAQPVGYWSGVEEVAGGVAEVRDGVVDIPLDLGLEETDAVVELGGYIVFLVGGCGVGADEGGVVGCYHGYVGVAAGAEFRVVVAGGCICLFGLGRGG